MKYCTQCGNTLSLRIPEDDDRHRHICDACEFVHYENPRVVVCSLPRFEDKVLMCKRAIEPKYGDWTLPGGFMENGETAQEAAARETREEAGALVSIKNLYTLFSLPQINQVHLIYIADLDEPTFEAGRESLEVCLMSANEIPWQELAFPPVKHALEHYFDDIKTGHFPMRVIDIFSKNENEHLIVPHQS